MVCLGCQPERMVIDDIWEDPRVSGALIGDLGLAALSLVYATEMVLVLWFWSVLQGGGGFT